MQQLFSRLAIVASILLLNACASGYQQFYKPAQGIDLERIASLRLGSPPETPIVERGGGL